MKKLIFSISLCALLLCGCSVTVSDHGGTDGPSLTLAKAQELRIASAGDPGAVQVIDSQEELDEFFQLLDHILTNDTYSQREVPAQEVPLGTVTFAQTETLKAGQDPEDREMEVLGTLTVYAGGAWAGLEMGPVTLALQPSPEDGAALCAYF